jgi:hypothetical protein
MLESEFTAPRPDCPHPEYWHSADSDSTEYEVTALVAAFVTALQPEFVVETGTAFGQTAEAVGRALLRNGHGRLVTLETDPDRATFSRERCAGLPVEVLEIASLDYKPKDAIDFAWFDSLTHLRALEYQRYRRFMTPRCVVGFHDTGPHHVTRKFLDPLVASGELSNPLWLPTPRGCMFARVGSE